MSFDPGPVAAALPDYDVGGLVGRGQFGLIWAGRHRELRREVAIKQLSGPMSDESAARFRREARLLAQLDHPHLVRVFDYREQGTLRLIVMEFLGGGTVADRADRLEHPAAIAVVLAAATGLQHAHDHGVVHRDVKPQNLMFDTRGTVKVTDFGIGSDATADATAAGLTQAGSFYGTPAYAAPEQAATVLGRPAEVTPAADQFALALVGYQLLAGRLPYEPSGTPVATLIRRADEPAVPLAAVAPSVATAVGDVIMRALRIRPADRFGSVEDFAVALAGAAGATWGTDWLAATGIEVRDPGRVLRAARGEDLPAANAPGPADRARTRSRTRVRVVGVGLVAALLIGAIAAVVVPRITNGPPTAPTPTTSVGSVGSSSPAVTWTVPTGGPVFSSPAIAGELAVVGSGDGSVYALDTTTGATRWEHPTGGPVRSSPAVADGAIFVGSDDGSLHRLNLADGAEQWAAPTGFEIVSSPAVSSGIVVIGSKTLFAFDEATGAPRWNHPTEGPVVSSPAIADGTVIVGSNDGRVHAVDLTTGTERWTIRTGGPVQSSPSIAAGVAFIGGVDGRIYALAVADGSIVWSADLRAPVKSSPLVDGDQVVVGTDGGRVVAFDRRSGRQRWVATVGGRVASSPTAVGDAIVVGTDRGDLVVLARTDGRPRGRVALGGPVLSSPAPLGRGLVVGTDAGSVVRVDLG